MEIKKEHLIQFVNLVNDCCAIMDHDYVAEWLTKPHPDLNMETPIELSNTQAGIDKVYKLLYFIEINEADL